MHAQICVHACDSGLHAQICVRTCVRVCMHTRDYECMRTFGCVSVRTRDCACKYQFMDVTVNPCMRLRVSVCV